MTTARHAAHQFVQQTRDPAASIHAAVISSGWSGNVDGENNIVEPRRFAVVRLYDTKEGTDLDIIVHGDD